MSKAELIRNMILRNLQDRDSFDAVSKEIAALFEQKPEPSPVEPCPKLWQVRGSRGPWLDAALVFVSSQGEYIAEVPGYGRSGWTQCRLNPRYAGLMVIHRHDGGPQPEETRGVDCVLWWRDKSGELHRTKCMANKWSLWDRTYAYAIVPEIEPEADNE